MTDDDEIESRDGANVEPARRGDRDARLAQYLYSCALSLAIKAAARISA